MDRFTAFVTSRRKAIVGLTLVCALLSAFMALMVSVNYDLVDYLPDSAESTQALDLMSEEFEESVPNARVMVGASDISHALSYKKKLSNIEGVSEVLWLDDVADISVPLPLLDTDAVQQYYRNGKALFEVSIVSGAEVQAMRDIYEIIGEEGSVSGEAIATAESKIMAGSETINALIILLPLILLILILSTTSWAEPLFFLLAIGVSVIINMGTNFFIGEVSFIAFAVSPILQLAVSLDYAIFLLHAFQDFREHEPNVVAAMRAALKKSFSSIAASAATTFFGFAALGFMEFRIGADLGFCLVKGIVFSFLSVVIFLPAFTLVAYKLIDKTKHRRLVPSFKNIGKRLAPFRVPVFCLVCLIVLPCYLAQGHTTYTYGMGSTPGSDTRAARDSAAINEEFGQSTPLVVLVPRGDTAREVALVNHLEDIPCITSVMSYVGIVGAEIPADFLDESITSPFYSRHYTRIIAYAQTASEGKVAFDVVEQVRTEVQEWYGDAGMTAGNTASLFDMKQIVTADSRTTNLLAIAAIVVVLLLVFRSITLPIILIVTIEAAIFINLSVPYFLGESLNYVGFLVINTVQLGATVDYAILFTNTYRINRQKMLLRPALTKTLSDTFLSILCSASILAAAGCVLWVTSTNNVVSLLGLLLFRGTALSFFMVITFLPGALFLFDRAIAKTTRCAHFLFCDKESK